MVEPIGRRAFLRRGALVMAAAAFGGSIGDVLRAAEESTKKPVLRLGMITDIHYADKPNGTTKRYYRESIAKMRESVARFNEVKPDFVVELGDLIDEAPTVEGEIGHLKRIDAEYAKFSGERHYVLGNHCVWSLTKKEFLENSGMKAEHYSFDRGGFHFVVLDACYRKDGVAYGAKNFVWDNTDIPPAERGWLADDLRATGKPTILFMHQRTDIVAREAITSGAEVRKILEDSGKVLAVFQGHHHINDHNEINGIHYCTMMAMVDGSGAENNAYALVDIHADGTVIVAGFRKQANYSLAPAKALHR